MAIRPQSESKVAKTARPVGLGHALNADAHPPRDAGSIILTIVVLMLSVALCASKLNLDLWYDEAYTLETYVSHGFWWIATHYVNPNNHVFYSLILRPFYLISDADACLRLPSLLSSVVTLMLTCWLAARRVASAAAPLAGLWLGLNQMFLIHTVQVRGYALSMTFAGALFLYATRSRIHCRWCWHAGAVALAAAFLYTIPTNSLVWGSLCAAAVLNVWLRERRLRVVAAEAGRWIIGAGVALALYAPILRSVLAQRAEPGGWAEGLHSFARFADFATRDAPWLWAVAALGLPWWWLRVRRDPSLGPFAFPAALILTGLGPFLLQSALRLKIPYDRVFCPLLPIWALAGGWLLWELLEPLRRSLRRSLPRVSVALVGGLVIAEVLLPRVLSYPTRLAAIRDRVLVQDGYYCYYAADFHPSRVVEYLKEALKSEPSYVVHWDRQGFSTFRHYLNRAGVPERRLAFDETGYCRAALYYIVPKLASLEDVSAKAAASIQTLQRAQHLQDFGYYQLYRVQVDLEATPLDAPDPAIQASRPK